MRRMVALLQIVTLGTAAANVPAERAVKFVDFYSPEREEKLFGDNLPLLARYTGAHREFAFAAAVHSSDPSSPTFRMIRTAFATIRPTAVILEGFPTSWGPNPARIMSKVTTASPVSSYDLGEDIYAARLAASVGATVWGAEPEDAEIVAALTKLGFARRDIFFASMFGPLAQDLEAKVFTEPNGAAFEKSYQQWATLNAKAYDPGAPLEASAFREWFVQHYGRPLDVDTQWSERGGPGQVGIAGKIGRASNRIRDQHMFALAARLSTRNKRVLLVAGGSHLSSQWRALQAAFGRPTIRTQW